MYYLMFISVHKPRPIQSPHYSADYALPQATANRPPRHNAALRKKLWLTVAAHVVQQEQVGTKGTTGGVVGG